MLALAVCLGLTVSASAYDMGKAGESIILSTGQWCTAAVDANGSLWIWGRNYSGYLVNGSKEDSLVPVKVMDSVASVSYVGSNAVVLKTDGSIWMWGNNQSGQLGNGTKTDSSTPVKVMALYGRGDGTAPARWATAARGMIRGSASVSQRVRGVRRPCLGRPPSRLSR